MGFRIGRKNASHVYPEPSRSGGAQAFARNFAQGPAANTPLAAGSQQISWATIESGAAPGVNVPITTHVVGGKIRVSCVVNASNAADAGFAALAVRVTVGGVPVLVPVSVQSTDSGGDVSIPFTFDLALVPGLYQIGIQLTASTATLTLIANSSTISIQELPAATG